MEYFSEFSSSNVARIAYEESTATLEVMFHNGGRYQYFDVPERVWDDFKRASSKGEFLHAHVKGHFRYSRV